MSDELITIAEVETAFEAELLKDELQENDIKAMVVGQNLDMIPMSRALMMVEVKVLEHDAEKAKTVLKAMQDSTDDTDDSGEEL